MAIKFLDTTPTPIADPVVDPARGWRLTEVWKNYFSRMPATLGSIPNILNVVSLSTQSASIGATDFSGTSLLAGLYRVMYHIRVTQAATTSSSLTVTLAWTEGGVAQSYVGSAITGNTLTTFQLATLLLRCDGAAPVSYAVAYASTGATPALYSLDVVIEKIKERT